MEVSTHLERLGRELRCPICLSLFKQAAALSCTHCFCQSCIFLSLKGTPFCPVCKVPAIKREVRTSPKMDNLVSIYRDMEAVHGITLFATQDPKALEPREKVIQTASKRFPSKKRVQAPQVGNTTNVEGTGKSRKKKRKATAEEEDMNPVSLNDFGGFEAELAKTKSCDFGRCEAPSSSKMRKQAEAEEQEFGRRSKNLAPFFWLSSQDDPEIKQACSTPDDAPVLPAFSDLKSSENRSTDHDMEDVSKEQTFDPFYWTQRPSSPELPCDTHEDMMNLIVEDSQDPFLPIKNFLEDDARKRETKRPGVSPVKKEPSCIKKVHSLRVPYTGHTSFARGNLQELNVKPGVSPARKKGKESFEVNRFPQDRAVPEPVATDKEPALCQSDSKRTGCAFCQRPDDCSLCGELMAYKSGLLVQRTGADQTIVHKLCAEWAPTVYFTDENESEVKNLESEISRSQKLKCTSCRRKGAALGCCIKSCRKSFHYPCAKSLSSCKWNTTKFLLLCPDHANRSFPGEKRKSLEKSKSREVKAAKLTHRPDKYILCGSGLDVREKELLAKFASATGSTVDSSWNPSVTHVIAGTDANGGARRTLKLLIGILEGKWILKPQWLSASISAGHPVDETPFETRCDVHGQLEEGPKRSRVLLKSQTPKLFHGIDFYLGELDGSMRTDMETVVRAGGGTVRKSVPLSDSTLVIYELGSDTQRKVAESIAVTTGAIALEHTWILDSIAGYRLQPLPGKTR